jgi:hypothetical protein
MAEHATRSLGEVGYDLPKEFVKGIHVPQIAFPGDENIPTKGFQLVPVALIASHVAREFSLPEGLASLRFRREPAAAMPVPKATVNEDSSLVLWQQDVRSTWKSARVRFKPQTGAVQVAASDRFRRGVPPSDACHHSTSGRAVNDVHRRGPSESPGKMQILARTSVRPYSLVVSRAKEPAAPVWQSLN